ncbi:MAG: LysE family transporter [Paracoccaceae bacterium]|nr:LysE family transporter [Paracoccaceae bacterium]
MAAASAGFFLGLGLILAIGAQNAFVLRQGLRREHVFWVCFACAASDAVLISAGVGGASAAAGAAPWLLVVLRWGGVAFLAVYGALRFRAAWAGGETLMPAAAARKSLGAALATCLVLTWLNPHVYLDTVVLIGSVSAAWPGAKLAFGAGAVAASFAFFFGLGYGARLLAPLFARPASWRVLDLAVGTTMWAIASRLALGG